VESGGPRSASGTLRGMAVSTVDMGLMMRGDVVDSSDVIPTTYMSKLAITGV
jgi:hypothetical protein